MPDPKPTNTDPAPVSLSEVEIKEFREMAKQFAELKAQNAAQAQMIATQEAALKSASETIEKMRADARRARFTDEVLGKSADNGARWFGEPDKHVAKLESLAKTFGEDSEQFKGYVTQQRAVAEAMKSSSMFREIGSSRPGANMTAEQEIENLAKAKAAAENITVEEATARVMSERPELYTRYRQEQKERLRNA